MSMFTRRMYAASRANACSMGTPSLFYQNLATPVTPVTAQKYKKGHSGLIPEQPVY